jgi:hypothetical protein
MEWVLLGVIAAVCVVLSILQYQWTGEGEQSRTGAAPGQT